ncbi:MAG: DnaJ domain-containing protein [Cytophagales bacterium]|nr:DnaJ domain-containing protein [Cytophagales bacterium]
MTDYYSILGVSRAAKADELKSAYKKLAKKYHPDKNQTNPEAENNFKQINEAYHTLSNVQKRMDYDRKWAENISSHSNSLNYGNTGAYNTNFYNQTMSNTSDDYQKQGMHYAHTANSKNEKKSDYYIIGITIFIIIAAACLIFGMYMNRLAAQEHYKTASFFHANENYTNAIMELNNAIHFDDEYTEAYLLRAECYFIIKKYENALFNYNVYTNLQSKSKNTINDEILQRKQYCKDWLKAEKGI